MPFATTDDRLKLYFEETGSGFPLLFVHEFAGDYRSWEPQVRWFSRRYRCITYNARGYPPSDVPTDPDRYSQERAVDDSVTMLDHLKISSAHVIGLSMGGFCALHLGLRFKRRANSLVVAGCGYGAQPEKQAAFRAECEATARLLESEGAARAAAQYAIGPSRVQFQNKDPRGWAEFARQFAEHSVVGSALTLRGVQQKRPSLYHMVPELQRLEVPTLIVSGDEDEGSLEPSLMLKRTIPSSALVVMPRTGHTCNLEEPDLFNRIVQDFVSTVEYRRWALRDPRSVATSLTGMESKS